MTTRLVALISAVLLLSLGSFALLMHRHQAGVMDELARTVSEVSRATLQTLELRAEDRLDAAAGPGGPHAIAIEGHLCADGELRGEAPKVVVAERVDSEQRSDASPATRRLITVRIDSVDAVTDPEHGLVLRIPTYGLGAAAAHESDGDGSTVRVERSFQQTNILLPVPTAEFRSLYGSLHRHSLLLLLGVFVVGTLMATSVASRFTRPIRRLDHALQRLTAGDLEVSVDTRGRDELARLSRAFNEMAASLRAHRARERELRRKEKLTALGMLAAGVAHDVRNPLHAINLTLDHLRDASAPDEPERRRQFDRGIEIIRDEIARLDRLVENFLAFARGGKNERVEVDVARLLEETGELVRKEAQQRRVVVELAVEDSLPLIWGDSAAIRSSILNLVVNAFEAMPDGGRLELVARRADGGVTVEVRDTGRGVPDQMRERLFEVAQTTKDHGCGLGLAMVHHVIVEEHRGRVELLSDEAAGTTVRLLLPVGDAERGEP
ncbi:MAG: HAMP domain-containing protein [Acidobacteriota bacterium]|nr:MAG: HAMP domain-containing protein [Acidobacteriota bacterium]